MARMSELMIDVEEMIRAGFTVDDIVEKRSKRLGRDRVTIRVLFNSGQSVQWTCPWSYLDILTKYRDRDRINTQEEVTKGSQKRANWNHFYNDWAILKARHAIRLEEGNSVEINKKNCPLYI